ncbi:hypothetical protein ACF1BQ_030565 [Bradyrhizobium sp. RDT10]
MIEGIQGIGAVALGDLNSGDPGKVERNLDTRLLELKAFGRHMCIIRVTTRVLV